MVSERTCAVELLRWFYHHGRDMPWRVKGGAHFDPYAVWISEIMLQQTTVKTVVDYFVRWMQLFPTIETLAAADLEKVLLAWQGLGYYTRAKKIHACAQVLVQQYQGKIPADRETLLKLPGIGPYTASSICCFAFNMPETVVDGNVIRIMARLYGLTHAVKREEIYQKAVRFTPPDKGADYASAIMDLGATVCTPSKPSCPICPWRQYCLACQQGIAEQIPLIVKPPKKEKKGSLWLVQNQEGGFLIRQRSGKGLLSGLFEFPWGYEEESPLFSRDFPLGKQIVHVFTHVKLTLDIYTLSVQTNPLSEGIFVKPEDFQKYPFSTLMRKVIRLIDTRKRS